MKLRAKCLAPDRNLPDLLLMARTLEMASMQAKQMEGSQPEKIEIKYNCTHRPMHQRKPIKYSPSMQRPSSAKLSIVQQEM